MAIDTKTTVGGVVTLLLSGTGGYLATNAISEGESVTPTLNKESRTGPEEEQTTITKNSPKDKDTQETQELQVAVTPEPRAETPDATQRSQEPVKAETSTNEEELERIMKQKITTNKFGNVNETEEGCRAALRKTDDSDNYKNAVKACFQGKTLKERASELGINLIGTEASQNETWKTRFDSFQDEEVHKMAEKSIATGIQWVATDKNDSTNIGNIKVFCAAVEKLTIKKIIAGTSQTLEEEWSSFLKGCAQNKEENKDFWVVATEG